MAADRPAHVGLARERTALAWNRSGLAVVVCVAVLVRHLWPISGPGRYVALGVIAAAAIVWATALFFFSSSRATGAVPGGPTIFCLMTVGTVMLAVVAIVLSFLVPP